MAYRTDYRGLCIKDSLCQLFVIKAVQILYRTAASAHYYYIQIHLIKSFYGGNNAPRSGLSLYKAWCKHYPHIRVSSVADISYIVDNRTGLCCRYSYTLHKLRYLSFIAWIKHSHIFKLFLQLQIFLIQLSLSGFFYLGSVELIPAFFFIA